MLIHSNENSYKVKVLLMIFMLKWEIEILLSSKYNICGQISSSVSYCAYYSHFSIYSSSWTYFHLRTLYRSQYMLCISHWKFIIKMGLDTIDQFNSATYVCLSKARTWIVFVFNDSRWDTVVSCVDVDCWPSVFKRLFYNCTTFDNITVNCPSSCCLLRKCKVTCIFHS